MKLRLLHAKTLLLVTFRFENQPPPKGDLGASQYAAQMAGFCWK